MIGRARTPQPGVAVHAGVDGAEWWGLGMTEQDGLVRIAVGLALMGGIAVAAVLNRRVRGRGPDRPAVALALVLFVLLGFATFVLAWGLVIIADLD